MNRGTTLADVVRRLNMSGVAVSRDHISGASEEPHSDWQGGGRRFSFIAAIYKYLHYRQHKTTASAPRLAVKLG